MKSIRHHVIFPAQLEFGVFFLKMFGRRRGTRTRFLALERCAEGTVGRAIWDMLDGMGPELVPYYERHDLKHVLLGYRPEACERDSDAGLHVRQRGLFAENGRAVLHVRRLDAGGVA